VEVFVHGALTDALTDEWYSHVLASSQSCDVKRKTFPPPITSLEKIRRAYF
jgi:hypothetical protein